MSEAITLLGATGSIGASTLDVVRRHPDRFHIHAVAGGRRVDELVAVARETHPKYVAIADEGRLDELEEKLLAAGLTGVTAMAGAGAMEALARDPESDAVVQAIVGAAGVAPTFAAAEAGKRLLLANKESVVCGGSLLMETIERNNATLLPVDSEHNAIFQCLQGASEEMRRTCRILLTASGGPFRGRKDLSGITPEEAVRHPKWSMGAKISVDSATLMNKGLEVIEARWLFDVPPERIDVVVHPQSVVHSAVEFADGSLIAQMGSTDMRHPIAYALGFPERLAGGNARLDLAAVGSLTFEKPDTETFPLLKMAFSALEAGGGASIVLNAANEVANAAFLNHEVAFTDIARTVGRMLETVVVGLPGDVTGILALDAEVRARTRELIDREIR